MLRSLSSAARLRLIALVLAMLALGLIALGGALSLFGRLFRERRNARRREEAE